MKIISVFVLSFLMSFSASSGWRDDYKSQIKGELSLIKWDQKNKTLQKFMGSYIMCNGFTLTVKDALQYMGAGGLGTNHKYDVQIYNDEAGPLVRIRDWYEAEYSKDVEYMSHFYEIEPRRFTHYASIAKHKDGSTKEGGNAWSKDVYYRMIMMRNGWPCHNMKAMHAEVNPSTD